MEEVDRLRKEARTFELTVEQKLTTYSRLESTADAQEAVRQVEKSKEVQDAIDKFALLADSFGKAIGPTPSRANAALAQRFRDIAADFRDSFRRAQEAHKRRSESAALFGWMQPDGAHTKERSGLDHLMRERGSLMQSHTETDSVISIAQETQNALRRQRTALSASGARVVTFISRLPGVGSLVDQISSRRTRNDTVLGLVMGLCVCFALWYFLLR